MRSEEDSILTLFPTQEKRIERLFIIDATFREMCTEFILCSSKILMLKNQGVADTGLLNEYEELQRILEHEMVARIFKQST